MSKFDNFVGKTVRLKKGVQGVPSEAFRQTAKVQAQWGCCNSRVRLSGEGIAGIRYWSLEELTSV